MSNTYTQLYIHIVFAVQNRMSLIKDEWKDRLYKYIIAIVQNEGHKMICIGGMSNHLHLFIGIKPSQSISSIVQRIKQKSSLWINENRLAHGRFSWQEGYGAFSCSRSNFQEVINYINSQEKHHNKKTMTEEYKQLLERYEIEYDPRYIFNEIE
ncbi:MAG: IS200/IS605 family transposase [Candidatus Cloacimonetes bacterium]|nr:IS200/IS605 family transposase [Candidatus Cloacimonadota bacterium]